MVLLLQVALPEDTTGAQRFTKRDASLALRPAEAGVVDQVRWRSAHSAAGVGLQLIYSRPYSTCPGRVVSPHVCVRHHS